MTKNKGYKKYTKRRDEVLAVLGERALSINAISSANRPPAGVRASSCGAWSRTARSRS